MDLRGDGGVLPFDQGSLASFDVHRFHLRVGNVAGIFQLPQVIAATVRQALDVNIALIVGSVLTHRLIGAIVQEEVHAIDALASHAIRFMNQNPAERLVFHRQSGGFAILDGEIMVSGIQLKALCRFGFQRVVVARVQ